MSRAEWFFLALALISFFIGIKDDGEFFEHKQEIQPPIKIQWVKN